MQEMPVEILDDSGDARGRSVSLLSTHLSRIGPVRDIHIGEIRPGCIRGNHYHARRGEIITVVYTDRWSLHWDNGPRTAVHVRDFRGTGALTVTPPAMWAHAIKNTGTEPMWIIAVSDQPFDDKVTDPVHRDSIKRVIVI